MGPAEETWSLKSLPTVTVLFAVSDPFLNLWPLFEVLQGRRVDILTAVAERARIKIALAIEAGVFAEVKARADTGFDGVGSIGFGDGGRGYECGQAGKSEKDGLEIHFDRFLLSSVKELGSC